MNGTTSSGTMEVGVMSDPTDPATFESVQIIQPATTGHIYYEINFTQTTLSGTGHHIAFRHLTVSSAYYYWLDDVTIQLVPSCLYPQNITVSNVTDNSVDVNWIDFDNYEGVTIYYSTDGVTFMDEYIPAFVATRAVKR